MSGVNTQNYNSETVLKCIDRNYHKLFSWTIILIFFVKEDVEDLYCHRWLLSLSKKQKKNRFEFLVLAILRTVYLTEKRDVWFVTMSSLSCD